MPVRQSHRRHALRKRAHHMQHSDGTTATLFLPPHATRQTVAIWPRALLTSAGFRWQRTARAPTSSADRRVDQALFTHSATSSTASRAAFCLRLSPSASQRACGERRRRRAWEAVDRNQASDPESVCACVRTESGREREEKERRETETQRGRAGAHLDDPRGVAVGGGDGGPVLLIPHREGEGQHKRQGHHVPEAAGGGGRGRWGAVGLDWIVVAQCVGDVESPCRGAHA